jgi:hypothetical protein
MDRDRQIRRARTVAAGAYLPFGDHGYNSGMFTAIWNEVEDKQSLRRRTRKLRLEVAHASDARDSIRASASCLICNKIADTEKSISNITWECMRFTDEDDDWVQYLNLCSWEEYLEAAENCSTCRLMVDHLRNEGLKESNCSNCKIVFKEYGEFNKWRPVSASLFSIGPVSLS